MYVTLQNNPNKVTYLEQWGAFSARLSICWGREIRRIVLNRERDAAEVAPGTKAREDPAFYGVVMFLPQVRYIPFQRCYRIFNSEFIMYLRPNSRGISRENPAAAGGIYSAG